MAPSAITDTPAPNGAKQAAQKDLPSPIHPSMIPRLDQDFIEYYNAYIAVKPVTHQVSMEDVRKYPKLYAASWAKDFTFEPFVNDIEIPGPDGNIIKARCYTPDPRTSPYGDGPYPIHINVHGGGFIFGDLTGDAELCMLVRDRVGIMVLDIDYRLSPEHVWYKGHADVWAAFKWVREQGKTINANIDSISMGGISAGGQITAVCQQLARNEGYQLKLALLAVPSVDEFISLKQPSDSPYPSYQENALSPCLSWKRIAYCGEVINSALHKDGDVVRPEFWHSPIRGDLGGLCRTFIATADCDPLRDEGEAYGTKLAASGVHVTMRRYMGVPHPFMHMLLISKGQEYVKDICAQLKIAHSL
ncbi:unnamed protein product [Clonostachys byssicola]|uniref:Alpha/beta hydrolase fold-3 domain-containing protein n=1 Tax=Clonostachys byssicola TaxID=160290 RepID=A0A9N9UCV9_9HYPO|nr:unnamed protein product [Clonostachys byssicola]